MRRAILAVTILALTYARPETYREKEDFQYSRSSSDDGNKSGFYGAQRGNTGGNYEKAHNMDSLAQHQMSSVVRQVDGELGTGADTKTGSVFTAGNSRGLYGSGQYDLSNLGGRNFQESVNYGNSHSSLLSQSSGFRGNSFSENNARYKSQQSQSSHQNVGYGTGESLSYSGNQQDLNQLNSNQEYGNQAANNYRYHSQSNSQGSSRYDQSMTASNAGTVDANSQRYVSTPVKLYIRPGIKTTIPLNVQSYDATQVDSSSLARSEHDNQRYVESGLNLKPKHFESSYSYKKEWEKHDTQPLASVPTENPFIKHSDLYDNSQLLNSQNIAQSSDTNSAYHGYSANSKYSSNSQQSKYQSGYKTGQNSAVGSNLQAYTANNQEIKSAGEIENLMGDINAKPKSYQSAYSYHKSWERRGDPYVIIPASDSNSQLAQRLTAASESHAKHSSHQHSSGYNYAQGNAEDCDCDEYGHVRVARSVDTDEYENIQQQSQDQLELLGQQQMQQNEWSNLEELGQQTQNKWDNLQSQTTQNKWDQLENLENQNEDHRLHKNLEGVTQETQNKWNNLEDLGQQSQNKWDNLESVAEQKPNKVDNSENLGQEAQSKWDQFEELHQHTLNNQKQFEESGQQTQNKWDNLETLNQQSENKLSMQELVQQVQNQMDQLESFSQQTQDNWNIENNEHSQRNLEQQGEIYSNIHGQQTDALNNVDKLHNFYTNQESHSTWNSLSNPNLITKTPVSEETVVNNNDFKNFWDQFDQENKISIASKNNTESDTRLDIKNETYSYSNFNTYNITQNTGGSQLNSLWNKIDNFAGYSQGHANNSKSYDFINTQESNNYWSNYNNKNEWNVTQNTDKQNVFNFDFNHHDTLDINTDKNNTTKPKNPFQDKESGLNSNTKPLNPKDPVDIGRGDIESEDTSTELTYNNPLDKLFETIPSNKNYLKTADEIESLSLKKIEKDKGEEISVNTELSVLGLDQNIDHSIIQKQINSHTNLDLNSMHTMTIPKITQKFNEPSKLETIAAIPHGLVKENIEQLELSHENDDNLQQQNVNQQFEDIDQNKYYHNLEGQTLVNSDQNMDDSQQLQKFEPIKSFVNQQNEEQKSQNPDLFPLNSDFQGQYDNGDQQRENSWDFETNMKHHKLEEPEVQKQRTLNLESAKNQNEEIILPIEVTEKPSFWKSVSSKLGNAKDSVVSWFKRS